MNLIKILDSDIKLFQLISSTGACTIEQARQVYDNKSQWYHYKRIQRLEEERYLLKRGKYLELTKRSADIIGEQKYRFRHPDLREVKAEVADLVLTLGVEFISARQIRNEYGLNRQTYFQGAIQVENSFYFLYLLGDIPSQKQLNLIRSEMKTGSISGLIRKSIVFAPSATAMSAFGTDTCKQDELFLLPHPAGVDLINQYFLSLDKIKIGEASKKPFAHYETESHYITVLILNDIAKRNALFSYYASPYQDKPVRIICLESQKMLFTTQYPQAEISVAKLS